MRASNTWISPPGSLAFFTKWINNTAVECCVIEDVGLLSARLSGTACPVGQLQAAGVAAAAAAEFANDSATSSMSFNSACQTFRSDLALVCQCLRIF